MSPRGILSGEIVDESVEMTLAEVSRCCGVQAEAVIAMVEEGMVEPRGRSPRDWRFPGPALRRIQITLRLRRDLDLNLAGAALALDLLEEIEDLRQRLRALERSLDED
jgi:chaperone modulatory protein CbpM